MSIITSSFQTLFLFAVRISRISFFLIPYCFYLLLSRPGVNMRSSTIILAPFLLFTGLVAAKGPKTIEVQPDFQGPQTGGICCDAGTNSDTDKSCSGNNLNAFCVSCIFFPLFFPFFISSDMKSISGVELTFL